MRVNMAIVLRDGQRSKRRRRRIKAAGILAVLILVSVILFNFPDSPSNKIKVASADAAISSGTSPILPVEVTIPKVPKRLLSTVNVSVKNNDTLYSILRDIKVPPSEILRIASESKEIYDLKRLRKGDTLTLALHEENIEKIDFRYADLEGMLIERDATSEDGFIASRYEIPHSVEETLVSGEIEDSLYSSAMRAGADPKSVMELSDIFAWDVDFATDIRKGDTFKILYETTYVDGMPISTGRILASEMVNKGKKYTSIYYEDSTGRGDYYDEDGKSLSRTLLKSPLRYRRISSYFAKKRLHPIHKKYRPHHGIDYAAPTGTPIETAGDGKVIFAGWKGGYGKYIKIRHNDKYTTAYGHLSQISKGIRKGARVKQGQVIGKVGATGDATGPHLHYEVVVRGNVVNPLSVKSKSRKTLSGEELARFSLVKNAVIAALGTDNATVMAMTEEPAAKNKAHN